MTTTGGDDSPKTADIATPKLLLRTYRRSDFEYVDHLWYSTYLSLVPEGVRRKLLSPLTWIIWFAVYSYLLMIVPILLSGLDVGRWAIWGLKIFFTLAWAIVAFAGLFVITDRFEAVAKVESVRSNDLGDPEKYYLYRDKNMLESRPSRNNPPSHFWVLLLDDKPCGMVGLAIFDRNIEDKSAVIPPVYMQLGSAFCRRYHLPIPRWLQFQPGDRKGNRFFARAHEPKTATLQRLAIKYEYQNCGLSTLLINRAMSWADEHGIERVYAKTDEMQTTAEVILEKRHGFKRLSKHKTGWFGQYESTWVCEVKKWVEANEKRKKQASQ